MEFGLTVVQATAEELHQRPAALTHERQRLREAGGTRELLELNRLAIARCHGELSYALIKRHLPSLSQPAA